MWGWIPAVRRLREDLAWEKHRNKLLRKQLAEKASECESWKWAAKQGMRPHEDVLICRTRERNAAARKAKQLQSRLDRVVRACARYRAEVAVQDVVVDRLTKQLFDARGYDDADRARLADPAAALTGEAA